MTLTIFRLFLGGLVASIAFTTLIYSLTPNTQYVDFYKGNHAFILVVASCLFCNNHLCTSLADNFFYLRLRTMFLFPFYSANKLLHRSKLFSSSFNLLTLLVACDRMSQIISCFCCAVSNPCC